MLHFNPIVKTLDSARALPVKSLLYGQKNSCNYDQINHFCSDTCFMINRCLIILVQIKKDCRFWLGGRLYLQRSNFVLQIVYNLSLVYLILILSGSGVFITHTTNIHGIYIGISVILYRLFELTLFLGGIRGCHDLKRFKIKNSCTFSVEVIIYSNIKFMVLTSKNGKLFVNNIIQIHFFPDTVRGARLNEQHEGIGQDCQKWFWNFPMVIILIKIYKKNTYFA